MSQVAAVVLVTGVCLSLAGHVMAGNDEVRRCLMLFEVLYAAERGS